MNTTAEQCQLTEDHAMKFLLRLKATLPELDENTGGEILCGLMESLEAYTHSRITSLAEEAEHSRILMLEAADGIEAYAYGQFAAWLRQKAEEREGSI
jgi:hypothetical protein